MWVPRGLIRSAGSLIYAIVNPVKLCHKYRLMPPLRPADVITARLALHNFTFSFFFLLGILLLHLTGFPEERVLVSVVYRVLTAMPAPRTLSFFIWERIYVRARNSPDYPFYFPLLSFTYSLPPFRVGPTLSRFKLITHS